MVDVKYTKPLQGIKFKILCVSIVNYLVELPIEPMYDMTEVKRKKVGSNFNAREYVKSDTYMAARLDGVSKFSKKIQWNI